MSCITLHPSFFQQKILFRGTLLLMLREWCSQNCWGKKNSQNHDTNWSNSHQACRIQFKLFQEEAWFAWTGCCCRTCFFNAVVFWVYPASTPMTYDRWSFMLREWRPQNCWGKNNSQNHYTKWSNSHQACQIQSKLFQEETSCAWKPGTGCCGRTCCFNAVVFWVYLASLKLSCRHGAWIWLNLCRQGPFFVQAAHKITDSRESSRNLR